MKRGTRMAGSRVPLARNPVDRMLWLVGDDAADASALKVRVIARLLLIGAAVENTEALRAWASQPQYALHVALCALFWIAAVAGWFERYTRYAAVAAAAGMVIHHISAFPLNANHHYLLLLCLALIAFFDHRSEEERSLLLAGLKWIALIGLFYAGIQKVLWGYYFRGEFLAYAIAQNERFSSFFSWLIPADELARLRALEMGEGAGPYRVDSPLFVAMSNLSYLGELILPPLLLFARTRTFAVAALLVYVFAIEAGAREVFFGLMIVGLLLLFAPASWLRRSFPVFLAAYVYVTLLALEWVPRWYFT